MKGKQVETSSSSNSSSEEEDDDDGDDDEDLSDDDQSSSSTSNLDEELIKLINKVEKMIQRLNVKGVPIKIQHFIFTDQRNEQRKKWCYGCGELGHFVEVCPNNTTPKTKKKLCKDKVLTSIRSWDNSSSEKEHHKRRGHKHSSSSTSRVCLMAWVNKKPIPSDSDNDSDDELPSYDEIMQENLNFAKVCTSQQKKLEKLKEKLDSSQQAYATLLEQYETFANLNMELSTKIE